MRNADTLEAMRKLPMLLVLASALFGADTKAEEGARAAMDRFMTTFNSRDVKQWASSLNFPHVRMASNNVRVYQTEDEFLKESANYVKGLGPGWDHSAWREMQVVQSGPDKVHFTVVFLRYDAVGKVIGTFPSLYIVTLKEGHWGVQARSSYAP
jgi:hypothetical protein